MFEKEVPLKKITDVKDKNMFSKSILIISVSLFLGMSMPIAIWNFFFFGRNYSKR